MALRINHVTFIVWTIRLLLLEHLLYARKTAANASKSQGICNQHSCPSFGLSSSTYKADPAAGYDLVAVLQRKEGFAHVLNAGRF